MGTILINANKAFFRSISDIREAYHFAFSRHASIIDEILDSDGIQYAAAVRNVMIHKSGRVDQEFFEQVAGIADIPILKDGDKFPLTGTLTQKLADDLISCCCRL